MSRFTPSRKYLSAGVLAAALGLVSCWFALRWTPSIVPTMLFFVTAAVLLFLAARPTIEIERQHLKIGGRSIPWTDIRAVDRTGWISPLVVFLTLGANKRLVLIYPGDLETSKALLRELRRNATQALIDGIPFREFWGEPAGQPATAQRKKLPSPRYPILRPEDEADVERLYQRLKTVGRLDPKSNDEK